MRKAFIVKGCFFALLLAGFLTLVSYAAEEQPAVKALTVETQGGGAKVVIEKVGSLECQEFILNNPSRLIVDFVGASHRLPAKEFAGDGMLVEKVRTSQFANDPQMITRVVFDMKRKTAHTITQESDRIIIEFTPAEQSGEPQAPAMMEASMVPSMGPAAAAAQKLPAAKTAPSATAPATAVSTPPASAMEAGNAPAANDAVENLQDFSRRNPIVKNERHAVPAALDEARAGDAMDQPESTPAMEIASAWQKSLPAAAAPAYMQDTEMQTSSMSRAMNKNITLDVQNADITTVLQSFSEFAGVNIIAGPEVTGEVEAHLKGVPWKQALQIVLKSHGFGYEEEYGVIRVSTVDKLTKEDLEKQAAERKKDELLPLRTEIIQLAYANAEEMQKALKKMVSQRGNIEVEKGSNAMIVTDIQKNVDEIASLAKSLDKKINQVEIIAKLVDVDVSATTEMGIRWDFLNISPGDGGFVGDAVIDAGAPSPIGKFRVGTVRSWGELRTVIDMLEQTNKAEIISNPRIITADNREASILVGKEIPLIVADEAGNPITELTKVGIGLSVTPHINLDNTITLDLHPEVSELSSQATVQGGVIISVSEADTRVMVKDGETAVIGGLMSQVESSLEQGLPILKDVPILGNLFKYKNDVTKKRELIIFITPRIVDNLAAQ